MFQSIHQSKTSKEDSSSNKRSDKPKVNYNEMADGHEMALDLGAQPAQMMVKEEEEKPKQGKMAQMKEEEELKQGKLVQQKPEEEELKQGKLTQQKPEEEEVQKKEGDTGQSNASIGSKTQMPEDVQAKMENAFGTGFGNVNIHQNDSSATQMGALAYTQGNNVHFAPGQYNPETQKGQELLGHELTHVVQQRQDRVQPTRQGKGMTVNDSPALEKEADVMGAKAAQGKDASEVAGKGSGVQMETDPEFHYTYHENKNITDKDIADYKTRTEHEYDKKIKDNSNDSYMDQLDHLSYAGNAVYAAMDEALYFQLSAYKEAYDNVQAVFDAASERRANEAALFSIFLTFIAGFAGNLAASALKQIFGVIKVPGVAVHGAIIEGLKDTLKLGIKSVKIPAPQYQEASGSEPMDLLLSGRKAISSEVSWFTSYLDMLSTYKKETEGFFSPLQALEQLKGEFTSLKTGAYEAKARADTKKLEIELWKGWISNYGRKFIQHESCWGLWGTYEDQIPKEGYEHLEELGMSKDVVEALRGPLDTIVY